MPRAVTVVIQRTDLHVIFRSKLVVQYIIAPGVVFFYVCSRLKGGCAQVPN